MTLGLFSIVINAGLLLFGTLDRVRAVRHRVHDRRLPDRRAVVRRPALGALVAAVVLSIISTVVGLVVHD